MVTSHCTTLCGWAGSVSVEKMGQGEVGVVIHRVTCTSWLLGLYLRVMDGTGWATSRPDCMDRLRKHYSHLVDGWFLASRLIACSIMSGYTVEPLFKDTSEIRTPH